VVLDSFQSIPSFVIGTDRIAGLPRRLAERLAPLSDRIIRPLPFSTAPLAEALWWHPTRERDPAHVWLRDVLRGIAPILRMVQLIHRETGLSDSAGGGCAFELNDRRRTRLGFRNRSKRSVLRKSAA